MTSKGDAASSPAKAASGGYVPAKVTATPKAVKYTAGVVSAVRKIVAKKKGGKPSVVSVLAQGEVLSHVTEWIPTGVREIDVTFGGGLPVGRCSEFFGPEQSGKSSLVRAAVRGVQSIGGFAVVADYELAMDPEKFESEGIDPHGVVYLSPETIEQGLDLFRNIIEQLEAHPPPFPVLMAWDSIAAAIAKAELEEETAEQSHVGVQARAMGKVFRSLIRRIAKSRVHLMFVNQERDKIGGYSRGGFKPMDTPGGKAAKYFSSLRVRCTRTGTLKVGKVATGYECRVQTQKAKLVPPHRDAAFIIDFTHGGVSPELSAFKTLLDARVLKVAGNGTYKAPFLDHPVDRYGFLDYMRENADGAWQTAQDEVERITRERQSVTPVLDTSDDDDDDFGGEDDDE